MEETMKRALLEILIYVSVLAALYGVCYGLCRAYNSGAGEIWEEVRT
jgi:hypothetical protein